MINQQLGNAYLGKDIFGAQLHLTHPRSITIGKKLLGLALIEFGGPWTGHQLIHGQLRKTQGLIHLQTHRPAVFHPQPTLMPRGTLGLKPHGYDTDWKLAQGMLGFHIDLKGRALRLIELDDQSSRGCVGFSLYFPPQHGITNHRHDFPLAVYFKSEFIHLTLHHLNRISGDLAHEPRAEGDLLQRLSGIKQFGGFKGSIPQQLQGNESILVGVEGYHLVAFALIRPIPVKGGSWAHFHLFRHGLDENFSNQ